MVSLLQAKADAAYQPELLDAARLAELEPSIQGPALSWLLPCEGQIHTVQAMELGLDGVLLNTAVAKALNPVRMARAFGLGIRTGRLGYEAGVMAKQDMAVASTPVAGYPILL